MTNTIYEAAKDTAKKIRKALKKEFPGVKFSVKSSTYSMGSSVDINYVDGPAQKDVQAVADRYQSASFDGMIDMETLHGYKDPEDGKIYSGAKYIFANRSLSPEYREQLEAIAEDIFGDYNKNDYRYHQWITQAEEQLQAAE